MYAMYFKQPTKDFCKFRFTLADWSKMTNFYDAVSIEPQYIQARAIYWRLWQANAFRFVECDCEHYPEMMQLHRLGGVGLSDFQKINSTIMSGVNELQNESKGLLSAIETLQVGYNEMKDHFATSLSDCTNFQSINVIDSVHTQINQIKKLFDNKFDVSDEKRKERFRLDDVGSTSRERSTNFVLSDTELDSELNDSMSSCDGSNDESTSCSANDDEDNECINIGTKRYNLKRNALKKGTDGLQRLRSSTSQTHHITRTGLKKSKEKKSNSPEKNLLQKNSISIIDDGGNIVISHPRKIYKRQSKEFRSSVWKQFIDYPG